MTPQTGRIFEFRAWDKENKCMYQNIEDCEGRYECYRCFSWYNCDDRYVIMQYTGLADKTGKEIYEGDIVGQEEVYQFLDREGWEPEKGLWKVIGERTKNFTSKKEEKYIAGYKLYIVKWEDQQCGFHPFANSNESCTECGDSTKYPRSTEVLGNIYENPDLLKKAI